MARIIPSDIGLLVLGGAQSSELEVLTQLEDWLGPEYVVFHSIHWSFSQGQSTHFGEIDFILVNSAGVVLYIEQKNGALEETPDGLVKVYGERRKSVGAQIHRSLNRVREKFQWQHPQARPLTLDYLLYCPDYRVRHLNAYRQAQERHFVRYGGALALGGSSARPAARGSGQYLLRILRPVPAGAWRNPGL